VVDLDAAFRQEFLDVPVERPKGGTSERPGR
jgi:hypothetical protein